MCVRNRRSLPVLISALIGGGLWVRGCDEAEDAAASAAVSAPPAPAIAAAAGGETLRRGSFCDSWSDYRLDGDVLELCPARCEAVNRGELRELELKSRCEQ